MLVLFVGPTGVGKTTLMEGLVSEHGCRLLPNFTTRPLRAFESSRSQLTKDQAVDLENEGQLAFLNCVFGNLYGVYKADLDAAKTSSTPYLFDVHVDVLWKLQQQADAIFFLVPENCEILKERLLADGRHERISLVADDYRRNLMAFDRLKHHENIHDKLVGHGTAAEALEYVSEVIRVLFQ